MIALLCFFLTLFSSPFKSKSRLEAENAALRRRVSGRLQLTNGDRLFLVMLYRWFPSVLKAITIIRPETLVRWHRADFRRLLAVEIPLSWRPTEDRCGTARADPVKSHTRASTITTPAALHRTAKGNEHRSHCLGDSSSLRRV